MSYEIPSPEELKNLRDAMGITQDQMGARLGIAREWISKMESGRAPISPATALKIRRLQSERAVTVDDPAASFGDALHATQERSKSVVALRNPPPAQPSTRADCESHMQQYFDAAEATGDADAFPYIARRIKQEFPLDEWEKEEKT